MVPSYALARSDTGAVLRIGYQEMCCKGGLAHIAAEPYIVQAPQKKVAQLSLEEGLPYCIVTCTLLMRLVHDLAMLTPRLSIWTDQLYMQGSGLSLLIPGTDHSNRPGRIAQSRHTSYSKDAASPSKSLPLRCSITPSHQPEGLDNAP